MQHLRTIVLIAAVAIFANYYHQQMTGYQSLLQKISAANAQHGKVGAGKRALVVGATSGIGKGLAMRLAKAEFAVSVVGRNEQRGNEVVDELKKIGGAGHEFIACDGELLGNVSRFVQDFQERHKEEPLDVLVISQGIFGLDGRTETKEGLDRKLALHYFGRMAYVHGLLPMLRKAENPRVMSVLAPGMHKSYPYYKEDFELKKHFSLGNAADACCMYNDIAADALSKDPQNANIRFIHANPGFVDTNIDAGLPWYLKSLSKAAKYFARSIEDSSEFLAHPILDTNEKGGFFLMAKDTDPASPTNLHEEARDHVWKSTVELLERYMK